MEFAPIALFVYNRPLYTRKTLELLSQNIFADESELFIFSDGAKENATAEDRAKIAEVRKIAGEKQWCKKVTVIESEKNKGLARSVIEGVTSIIGRCGKIIVVEDDVLLSKYFLKFMNEALEWYKEDERVFSIASWNYFCPPEKLEDNFFLRYPDTKGWATYLRAWKLFEPDALKLYESLKKEKKLRYFNANGCLRYMEDMLLLQVNGKIDSWAIRWTAVHTLYNGLTFFPRQTLSKDIGFGDTATHDRYADYNLHLTVTDAPVEIKKQEVAETITAIREWKKFIYRLMNFTLLKCIRQEIRRILGKRF